MPSGWRLLHMMISKRFLPRLAVGALRLSLQNGMLHLQQMILVAYLFRGPFPEAKQEWHPAPLPRSFSHDAGRRAACLPGQ